MSLTLESTVVSGKDQVSARLDDEAIVLSLDEGMYYGMDAVGSRIWELLQEPRTVVQIRDTITHEYDVDEATCERDLLAFLRDLETKGLLEIRDAG